MIPKKVLFLGNSITWHPAVPEDGFMNTCGMAASSEDKDFVHILLQRFAAASGGQTPESIIQNIADFERQHMSMDIAEYFKQHVDFQADTLILAIGENVPALETPEAQAVYEKGLEDMLTLLKASGCSNIIIRSCFWPDTVKDNIMKKVCDKFSGIWVDLSHLSQDEANYARSEREYKHEGVAGHPGDRGMLGIANAIWDVAFKKE